MIFLYNASKNKDERLYLEPVRVFAFSIFVGRGLEHWLVNLARLSTDADPCLLFVLSARTFPVGSAFKS